MTPAAGGKRTSDSVVLKVGNCRPWSASYRRACFTKPRAVAVPGMLLGAVVLLWLKRIDLELSYITHFMPAVFGLAFGFAMGIMALTLTAVRGVPPQDTGIASALLNASQQIGVAFGLAVLSTISVAATSGRMSDALGTLQRARSVREGELTRSASEALVHGYSVALVGGAVALLLAALITFILVTARKSEVSPDGLHIG